MKICLYDWNHGGHHPAFLRLFAEALHPDHEVVIAASDPTLEELSDLPVESFGLGAPRPRPIRVGTAGKAEQAFDKAGLAREDLENLQRAIAATNPDEVGALYADPILRWLVRMDPLPIPTSLCIHFPRFHYARSFGSHLPAKERLRARFQQALVARWRKRPDAKTLFSVDGEAVRIWNRSSPGLAPALCVREPPIPHPPEPQPGRKRRGSMVFGYIDERKGLDRIAAGLGEGTTGLELLIAGRNAPEYAAELGRHIEAMRAGGVTVERISQINTADALERIASARCVLLAFGLHPAASRVLLEAATVGTPVVAPDWGLIGHLVREHRLGVLVDPSDPRAIRDAVLDFSTGRRSREPFAAAQAAYVTHCGWDPFRATVRRGFGPLTPPGRRAPDRAPSAMHATGKETGQQEC